MGLIDKDNPKSWVKFKSNLCENCRSLCCTMPVEIKIQDLIRLELAHEGENPKQVFSRLKKAGFIHSYRAKTGLFRLTQKSNDDCVFLNSNRKCSVYEKRPEVCRLFPEKMGLRLGFCPALKIK